jgi:hypothetical protein
MKEIIGDDYPTYEDSVNMTLSEKKESLKFPYLRESDKEEILLHLLKEKEDGYTYLSEVEHQIHKDNLERLMKENLELRHRLDCIASDIELVARHICKYDSAEIFKLPSLESNGKIFADEAWHNITNIEIACDLNDDSSLGWGAKCTHELDNLNRDL